MRRSPCLLPILCAAACAFSVRATAEQAPKRDVKHLTIPFKTLAAPAWAPDGSYYVSEIEDRVLGRLTLTIRIALVGDATYTVAADGTDWEASYPLPPESSAGPVLRAKKRELGEPLDDRRREALVRFCLGAAYFRYAESELEGFPEPLRSELTARIVEARVRTALLSAQELSQTGQLEEAGRLLAGAMTLLAAPPSDANAAARRQDLERDGRELQVRLSAEAQARAAWQERVRLIREALQDAPGEEGALIRQLLPDLEGPLSAARRSGILYELHAEDRQSLNYTQALDALKQLTFAVRYGEVLAREDTPGLDAFFDAEALVNSYMDASAAAAPSLLERLLALRGFTDKALTALIRRGRRVPPPEPAAGESPQGPLALRAPTAELEVALDYQVVLPVDYHPSRPRPLVIALHGTYAEARTALQMWAPEALKRGWLAAAPECVIGRGKGYLSTPEERALLRRLLADCTRRFAVDPNRVYLVGHSMGAYMAWDAALTAPDRFAAIVPVCGCVNGMSANYLSNLCDFGVYCLSGEKDTAITRVNRLVRGELAKAKLPWTYVEYPARGNETFLEEFPKVFAWLEKQARPNPPAQVDFVSADVETTRVHWLSMLAADPKKDDPAVGADKLPLAIRPQGLARLAGTVRPGNLVQLQTRNLRGLRLWIMDGLFDLTKPLRVSFNGRVEQPVPFQCTRKRVLESARATGDRERLFWGSVDLPVPQ